jgi:hypothetical protein
MPLGSEEKYNISQDNRYMDGLSNPQRSEYELEIFVPNHDICYRSKCVCIKLTLLAKFRMSGLQETYGQRKYISA